LAQFGGAVILFGSPLFFVYGLPRSGSTAAVALQWPRRLLLAAGLALLAGACVSLATQTATMTGEPAQAFNPSALWDVLSVTQFGLAVAVRLAITLLILLVSRIARPSRTVWFALAGLGAAVLASFAWSGHGAVEEGAAGLVHAVADVIHLLAAGVWLGALAVLAILLCTPSREDDQVAVDALHKGLAGFSGIGTAVVAALVLTGLINSWFLVGPTHVFDILGSAYGLLLLVKLGIFGGTLVLAGLNRFVLTPALSTALAEGSTEGAIHALRRSVLIESAAALAVIALVSALGTLVPVSALE
jgi:putative copper resistance protein D